MHAVAMGRARPAPPALPPVSCNPLWRIRTGRLQLAPVAFDDFGDLAALKADPLAFGMLYGGVRDRERAMLELGQDIAFWGRTGVGMWAVRIASPARCGALVGITGIMERVDGRGMALRFALGAHWRGRGYAAEMASAALRFAHERAHLPVVIAVARETNMESRTLLASIGMTVRETFMQKGWRMFLYASEAPG
jgi:RimJ/RimL family protein N-acetyltransferase